MAPWAKQFDGLRRFLKRVRLWNIAVIVYLMVSWAVIFGLFSLFKQFVAMAFR